MFIRLLQPWRAWKAGVVVAVSDGYGNGLIRAKRAEQVDPDQKTHDPTLPAKKPKGPGDKYAKRTKKKAG